MEKELNESTVRYWVSSYKKELERKRKLGETVPDVKMLPVAKRGRPLLIGDKLESLLPGIVTNFMKISRMVVPN